MIENPFKILRSVFSQNTRMNGTLYVPTGTKEDYKATDGWKDFVFIEEGTGGNDPVTPETKKCEKPTISYQNGKLTFNSDTEGATCVSSITDADMGTYTTNEVQLGVTYSISVYATKAGYENSETVMATLCWIDVEPKTEGIGTEVAAVRARTVLIQSQNGVLSISGAEPGQSVRCFSLSGVQLASATTADDTTRVDTNLRSSEAVIVRIGDKSIKVLVK